MTSNAPVSISNDPNREREIEHQKLVANSQPVRLVSIDDVTIGQLVSLSFKVLIAGIPLAFVIGIIWLGVRAVASSFH